jgi:hypothetical protein
MITEMDAREAIKYGVDPSLVADLTALPQQADECDHGVPMVGADCAECDAEMAEGFANGEPADYDPHDPENWCDPDAMYDAAGDR